jgi:glutaredoxin
MPASHSKITTTIGKLWLISLLLLATSIAVMPALAQTVADEQILEVFVRDGCPHCAEAKQFLPAFSKQHPELKLVVRQVDHDKAALRDLIRHAQNAGSWPPGVPTFVFNQQVIVGFEGAARTGAKLDALVRQQPSSISDLSETLPFANLGLSNVGLPLFTLTLGLLDGFNPCAMWVLLFLLSLLVHLQDRKRMILVAGTFVLTSGLVYYAFMAAWLNVFLLLGLSAILRYILGLMALVIGTINIKDFLRPGAGFTLSIPDTAKPGIFARMRRVMAADTLLPSLTAVATLGVMVNFIELLCTAGLPAVYTAILAQQNLNPASHYAYLALYIVGYIADDTLMVAIAVIALSSRKLTEKTGRWLKLLSGGIMLGLGATMLLRPEWLI